MSSPLSQSLLNVLLSLPKSKLATTSKFAASIPTRPTVSPPRPNQASSPSSPATTSSPTTKLPSALASPSKKHVQNTVQYALNPRSRAILEFLSYSPVTSHGSVPTNLLFTHIDDFGQHSKLKGPTCMEVFYSALQFTIHLHTFDL